MNKIVITALSVILSGHLTGQAQGIVTLTCHEIAVGTGNSIVVMTPRPDSFYGEDIHARHCLRIPLSIHYLYHTSEKWAVGGTFHYEPLERREFNFSLMPQAKWRWFNRKYVGMYSRVAVGLLYRNDLTQANRFLPGIQFSPFGVEAGLEHVRAYADIGVGTQNIVQLGLKYEF